MNYNRKKINKKGFTLVELLGVIIVLAIISLIAVPITLKIIDISRKNRFKVSAEGVIRAATMYYSDNTDKVYTHFKKSGKDHITFEFDEIVGKKGINELGDTLDLSGKVPVGGEVIVYKTGDVEVVNLTDGFYYVNKKVDENIEVIDDSEGPTRTELDKMIKDLKKEVDKIKSKNEDQDKKIDKNTSDIDKINDKINNINTNILDKTYPIGSIYISTNETNPTTLFGGTWERYGEGKTLVSLDSNNSNFDTVNKTGGKSSITLSTDNLPAHTHSIPKLSGNSNSAGGHTHTYSGNTNTTGNHTHSIPKLTGSSNAAGNHTHEIRIPFLQDGFGINIGPNTHYLKNLDLTLGYTGENGGFSNQNATYGISSGAQGQHSHTISTNASTSGSAGNHAHSYSGTTSSSSSHTHTVSTNESNTGQSGSTKAFSIQNPYITVYMWKRIK